MINAKVYLDDFRHYCIKAKGEAYCTDKTVAALMAVSRHETCFSMCPPFQFAETTGDPMREDCR